MLIVETADMLQAPLFTAEALLRAHGAFIGEKRLSRPFCDYDSIKYFCLHSSFFRLGQRKASWSLDVQRRGLLPALRRLHADPAAQRLQRLGHPAVSPHSEDTAITPDPHPHFPHRQLPHAWRGGPGHGEQRENGKNFYPSEFRSKCEKLNLLSWAFLISCSFLLKFVNINDILEFIS